MKRGGAGCKAPEAHLCRQEPGFQLGSRGWHLIGSACSASGPGHGTFSCSRPWGRVMALDGNPLLSSLRSRGTSSPPVKTQIWCAVATYVLIVIVKKELRLDASLYTCSQILSVSIFGKTEISCALQPDQLREKSPHRLTNSFYLTSNRTLGMGGTPSFSSIRSHCTLLLISWPDVR